VDTGQRIVHALKYEGWWRVADGAAVRMARLDWPADVIEERAALIPVPLAVVTTAATLNACAGALHDAGIRIVSYVTFGRAPAIGDRL
jgi:hypothetical protein